MTQSVAPCRHRFTVSIISQAVWSYHRFNHSYREHRQVKLTAPFLGYILLDIYKDQNTFEEWIEYQKKIWILPQSPIRRQNYVQSYIAD